MTIDFIDVTPESGTGGGTLNVAANTNTSTMARSTDLNIQYDSLIKSVDVSQAGAPQGITITNTSFGRPAYTDWVCRPALAEGQQTSYWQNGDQILMVPHVNGMTSPPVVDVTIEFYDAIQNVNAQHYGPNSDDWDYSANAYSININKTNFVMDDTEEQSAAFNITFSGNRRLMIAVVLNVSD